MKSAHGFKSAFWSIVKYLFAFGMLALILKNAHGDKIAATLKQIPPLYLFLGFTFIMLAQLASAMRMRYFFIRSGFALNKKYATILFFVGGFYNFLLPGGIGGDAYKVVLVRHRMNVSTKQGVRIMLADRASGLCVLMLTMLGTLLLL